MNITASDLGQNALILLERVKKISGGNFVDLGVRFGTSSYILLQDSDKNDNHVYGVDISQNVEDIIVNNYRYTFILSDSVLAGENWDSDKSVNILFIDTLHIKDHVLCELNAWYKHLSDKALLVFHDTNWPPDKRDYYKGQYWDRPEEAIKQFFDIDELNVDNENIKVEHFPYSWGMTFVQLKNKNKQFGEKIIWKDILKFREN
jgi:cephalosporin hydroxylase